MNLELAICPHEAGSLITTLVQRCTSLEEMLDSAREHAEEIIELNTTLDQRLNELNAEILGMSAGAQLDAATEGVNNLIPRYTTLASNLADEMRSWESELAALLRTHQGIGPIDIDTVSNYLRPFAERVANWRNSINTIINTPATQEA